MKFIALLALLATSAFAAAPASQPGNAAWVMITHNYDGMAELPEYFTQNEMLDIYYLDEPCRLPLARASEMRRHVQRFINMEGCWAPTLGGGIVWIWADGTGDGDRDIQWEHYYHKILILPSGMGKRL